MIDFAEESYQELFNEWFRRKLPDQALIFLSYPAIVHSARCVLRYHGGRICIVVLDFPEDSEGCIVISVGFCVSKCAYLGCRV